MPLLFRCCVMHGRTVHSNAMANQSRTTLYLALACQSFARPLRFIELRFHELHFLCITPPICALLCPSFSLRVKTSPHHCLSKLCCAYLAVANLCQSMLCRCLSTLGRCVAVQINTFAVRNRSQVRFAVANAIHSKSKLCRRCFCHGYHLHHSCVHAPTCAGL